MGLMGSADETRSDVTDDKHKSFVLTALFKATVEMDTMETRCVSAWLDSASQLQFMEPIHTHTHTPPLLWSL